VKDVSFTVNNIEQVVEQAKAKGGKIVKDVWTEKDEHGSVKMACIQTVNSYL
jgi:predicted enzyme related to lactoylglutathione lyase